MLSRTSSPDPAFRFRRLLPAALTAALAFFPAAASAIPVDPSFDPGFGASEKVHALGVQSFGSTGSRLIVIGGAFTAVAGQPQMGLARFHEDGSLDPTFLGETDGTVWDLEVVFGNQIIVGGSFGSIDGVALPGLARLNADGSLDTSFEARVNGTVLAITRQSDGKLLVGGIFSQANGQPAGNIARFLPSGALDPSFQTGWGAEGFVTAIELDYDRRIVVGGGFSVFNGQPRSRLVRLLPNGGIDASFNGSADGVVRALAPQLSQRIVVGGSFGQLSGRPQKNVGRLNFDGSYDATWDGETDGTVEALSFSPFGRLMIGGSFSRFRGEPHANLVQLNFDDRLDATEQTGTDGTIHRIHQSLLGSFVAGDFRYAGGAERNRVASLAARYRSDRGFDPPSTGSGTTTAIIHQNDGGFLLAGSFTLEPGGSTPQIRYLARLLPDGGIDPSYRPQPNRDVAALFALPDGSVLAGGEFTEIGGNPSRKYLARLLPNGAVDGSYLGQSPYPVAAFAPHAGGKVLMIARQSWPEQRSRLMRLLPSGAPDPSFLFPAEIAGQLYALAVQPDGRILVGADAPVFIGGASRQLFRLLPDGSFDPSFEADVKGWVAVVAPLSDGRILAGGRFYEVAGQPRMALVRLEASGALDPLFAPPLLVDPAYNSVSSITPMVTGKATVAGSLLANDQRFRPYLCTLCQFLPDGSLDPLRTEDYYGHFNGFLVPADGSAVLAHQPNASYGGDSHEVAGRYFPAEPVEQTLSFAARTLTWRRKGPVPVLSGVRFEVSADGGQSWTLLPAPTATADGWRLDGLVYPNPAGLKFRATGSHPTGRYNGSTTLFRQVLAIADPSLPPEM